MARKGIVTLVACMMLVLAACERQPVAGLITAKRYRAAYTQMILMPVSTGRVTVLIPMYFHHPERWVLSIERYDAQGRPTDVVDLYVVQSVYEHVDEGSWFVEKPEMIDTTPTRKTQDKEP